MSISTTHIMIHMQKLGAKITKVEKFQLNYGGYVLQLLNSSSNINAPKEF